MDAPRWGPDPDDVPLVAVHGLIDVPDVGVFVAEVQRLSAALGVPVQALRADRVLSWVHLVMAREHAKRAASAGRARGRDAAVEFVVYAGCDRQIGRALEVVGVPAGQEASVWLVALKAVEPSDLAGAAESLGMRVDAIWSAGQRERPPRVETDLQAACESWAQRLRTTGGASTTEVEESLLTAMALLAVQKT